MLVYANHLRVQGADAKLAVFRAIGGWLKEQLGFGFHPDQLKQDGEYNGRRGENRSRLRIHECYDGDPALCAWVLKHADESVHGRQWIVEVGFKKFAGTMEVSCVVKTDERSALVSSPVSASQPRVIRYIANNVLDAKDADFTDAEPGEILRTVGHDLDSYPAFLAEVERPDRDGAIVLVSATHQGEYLVNPPELQRTLIGLAQVVQVLPESNSYEMREILGQLRSAWGGALNVLPIPSSSGIVRPRYFLRDEIRGWGEEPQRISQVLAHVTANTNIPRLQMHVRPEGVIQLSMRRRMEKARATSTQMTVAQLRQELDEASKREIEYEHYFEETVEHIAGLEAELSRYKDDLEETQGKLRKNEYQLKSFKTQLRATGNGDAFNPEVLLELATRREEPSPVDCIKIIEDLYGNRCTVLDSAWNSARKTTHFIHSVSSGQGWFACSFATTDRLDV